MMLRRSEHVNSIDDITDVAAAAAEFRRSHANAESRVQDIGPYVHCTSLNFNTIYSSSKICR